jgi:hypothetical protein
MSSAPRPQERGPERVTTVDADSSFEPGERREELERLQRAAEVKADLENYASESAAFFGEASPKHIMRDFNQEKAAASQVSNKNTNTTGSSVTVTQDKLQDNASHITTNRAKGRFPPTQIFHSEHTNLTIARIWLSSVEKTMSGSASVNNNSRNLDFNGNAVDPNSLDHLLMNPALGNENSEAVSQLIIVGTDHYETNAGALEKLLNEVDPVFVGIETCEER